MEAVWTMHRFDFLRADQPGGGARAAARARRRREDHGRRHGADPVMRQRLVRPAVIVSLRQVPAAATGRGRRRRYPDRHAVTHRRAETRRWCASASRARGDAGARGDDPHPEHGHGGRQPRPRRPRQDPPATLIALGASVDAGRAGRRARDPAGGVLHRLLRDARWSRARCSRTINVPPPPAGHAQASSKFLPRSADDYATVAVSVSWRFAGRQALRGGADRAGLGRADAPARARRGGRAARPGANRRRPARGREAAAAECDPLTDIRGSAEYKREMVKVWLARTVRRALERMSFSSAG